MRLPPLHFSIDDTFSCVRDLFATRTHSQAWVSAFEQPTFAYLRALHERFGLCVSLYLFAEDTAEPGWTLREVDDRYRDELAAASHWLRFGFHGRNDSTRYSTGTTTFDSAGADYAEIVSAIETLASSAAVDTAPRVHFYTGCREAVAAWCSATHGIRGLLTADDDRAEVYYLGEEQRTAVRQVGTIFDPDAGLWLFRTDLRLERPADTPQRLLDAALANAGGSATARVFTHEAHVTKTAVRQRLEDLCARWQAAGGGFAFPLEN